jgi:glucose-1-phosphate thymidylyltransferase
MRRGGGSARIGPEQAAMADAGLKSMIPFRRPFLDYLLSSLADAGCRDVCLVIGPDHGVVRDFYASSPPTRVRLTFAVQPAPLGTADAVLAAEAFAAGEPFLVMNADNYYPSEVLRALASLDGQGLAAFRRSALVAGGNIDSDRVASFAALEIAQDGALLDIVEKPDAAALARFGDDFYVSMNCWRFAPEIFEACRRTAPSSRGEIELPAAVRLAMKSLGQRFQAVPVDAGVLDLSHRTDIAEVERRLAHIDPRP